MRLTAQDRQLVAEHEDLGVLGEIIHPMDAHELGDAADQEVEEAERHDMEDRRPDRAWSS